ncbi:endonuclease/exonuclease/phosphatase family protein [Sphingobacterium cellulitidis]|uniref:endonuclease/exonuclease/phosphatase family protein n=1 Tax=Sphingobacterium cellulitidis TaxID=1768011 RepID=UPI000B943FBD|nr:endonuclease [Sphingobacterium cellulitidis]
MSHSENNNRRAFFKKLGLLASLPILGQFDLHAEESSRSNQIKVLTCNIRVDLEEDAAKGLGWKDRREACLAVIKRQKADLIGFQEVLKGQFLDLKEQLTDYFAFGFDGPEMDQYKEGYHGIAKNPILFSKKRFELLAASAYWLSETPLKAGSMSWGSARARNAVNVRLLDKKTKREIRLSNLHLDHISNEAKEGQIKVVLGDAAQYQADFPQVLTGDFNVGMDSNVYRDVMEAGWKDSYVQVKGDEIPEGTTHGFKGDNPSRKKSKKIDFIFMKGPLKAVETNIIKDSYKGMLPSDHYFVSAVLEYQ